MNAIPFRLAALCTLLLAGTAHAEYLCAKPPTSIDRRACEAARQSPQALRQFVQRMAWHHQNLNFFDYVDETTQLTWDKQRALQTADVGPGQLALHVDGRR